MTTPLHLDDGQIAVIIHKRAEEALADGDTPLFEALSEGLHVLVNRFSKEEAETFKREAPMGGS